MANEYDIEDLYGKYDNGEEGVTLNALQAIIANLIVDSANIRDGAIKNAHIESLNARKIYSVGGATSDTNIALGKTISSNVAEDATHPWSKLNDGTKVKGTANYAGFGTGSTGAEVNYIQYDLGTSYRLAESKIYFYAMDNRYYRYKIKYSEDGQNWYYAVGDANTWAKSVPANLGGSTMNPTKNTFSMPIVARYVRLYADGNSVNGGNHADEWELFSYEQTTIEGGMLRANTVIADDIIFTGTLQGADGTFSGTLDVTGNGNRVQITNGQVSAYETASSRSAVLAGGKMSVSGWNPYLRLEIDGVSLISYDNSLPDFEDAASIKFNRRSSGIVDLDLSSTSTAGNGKINLNTATYAKGGLWLEGQNVYNVQYLSGKFGNVFASYDEWLRFNEGQEHSSGVYFGTSLVRTDGQFQIGSGGSTFLVSPSAITYKGKEIMTGNNGTIRAVYTDTTRLRGTFTHNMNIANTPIVTAEWKTGDVSMSNVNNYYIENVTNNSFDIVVAGSGFASGQGLNFKCGIFVQK